MESAMMIQTRDLSRSFGAREVVSNLNLKVPEKVVYGFLGPNGAGKTTTIRMLLGLIHPTSGSVHLFGQRIKAGDWHHLQQVGSLVESPSPYPNLTGRENLEVVRRMLELPKANIDRVLSIVKLSNHADRLVRQYSLGMQQRLAIALSLLNQPRLLILDEPTNGLDPSGIHEIRDFIRDMPEKEGITVFLSSHLLSEVELMASHVGIIQAGKLCFQGSLRELQKNWRPIVRIEVRQVEEAKAVLRGLGLQARMQDHMLEIKDVPDEDVPEIHRALVAHGVALKQFYLHKMKLEEMFLEITNHSDGEVQ